MPQVSDLLTRCALKRPAILNCLRASGAPAAQSFLEAYRELPKRDAGTLPLEAICLKADVNPLELLGAVLMAAKSMKAQESALRAIMAHPDVVQATIDSAKDVKNGFADRKMLNEAVGFLPTKQGSNIAINLLNGQPVRGEADEDGPDADDEAFEAAFPTISANLEEWSENRRLLTDGK